MRTTLDLVPLSPGTTITVSFPRLWHPQQQQKQQDGLFSGIRGGPRSPAGRHSRTTCTRLPAPASRSLSTLDTGAST